MKYDKVKNNLEAHIKWGEYSLEDIEMFRACLEIIEKKNPQIPLKKRALEDLDFYIGHCPCCNEGANSDMNYCGVCGQALDWGEEE